MLNDISLQNPTITRMLYLQLGITVGFAVIAGIHLGEHGAVSATLGGLTNVFASLIFCVRGQFWFTPLERCRSLASASGGTRKNLCLSPFSSV